jgi:hypothetical protein
MKMQRNTSGLPLLLLVLGAVAMAVVAVRSGDDLVGRGLASVALGCLVWAAVAKRQQHRQARARR